MNTDDQTKPIKRTRRSSSLSKVMLKEDFQKKVRGWKEQIEQQSMGILSPSVSDIVNHLLANLPESLPKKEIDLFIQNKVTADRIFSWAAQRMKEAQQSGDTRAAEEAVKQGMKYLSSKTKPKSKKSAPKKLSSMTPSKMSQITEITKINS